MARTRRRLERDIRGLVRVAQFQMRQGQEQQHPTSGFTLFSRGVEERGQAVARRRGPPMQEIAPRAQRMGVAQDLEVTHRRGRVDTLLSEARRLIPRSFGQREKAEVDERIGVTRRHPDTLTPR